MSTATVTKSIEFTTRELRVAIDQLPYADMAQLVIDVYMRLDRSGQRIVKDHITEEQNGENAI